MSSPEFDPQRELPPIPVPAHKRWEEFRFSYLPKIVLAGTIVAAGALWSKYVTPRSAQEQEPRIPPVPALTNSWPEK